MSPSPASPPEGDQSPAQDAGSALPVGTRLADFAVTGLVGEGGFGIVYLASDLFLQRAVAIKEYMPSALARRLDDGRVVVRSQRHEETFAAGMRSFINEARLLARFDHPALVKVYRFWEANGTAYMAMPYYRGGGGYEEVDQSYFSPNRLISSAVMFGSLPTGVVSKRAWETLLFSPGPMQNSSR